MRLTLEEFGNEVNWDSNFGLCGMGFSKSEKIFPPDTIIITINKASLSYKGSINYILTCYDHAEDIKKIVPSNIPFVVIEKEDYIKFHLALGGPISSALYFISKRIKDNHTIFILGNDMDGDSRDWNPYISSFYSCWLDNIQYRKTIKVVQLDSNTKLPFFNESR